MLGDLEVSLIQYPRFQTQQQGSPHPVEIFLIRDAEANK
jgi:hypothetical protein